MQQQQPTEEYQDNIQTQAANLVHNFPVHNVLPLRSSGTLPRPNDDVPDDHFGRTVGN